MMKLKKLALLVTVISCSFATIKGQNADVELVKKHVYTLAADELLGRGFGSSTGQIAAEYIRSQMIEAGIEPLLEDYYHEFIHRSGVLNIQGRNVVGIVRGSDPVLKNEYIILGAHYDHIGWEFGDTHADTVVYNGADDNASGTASVIEIGRYLAANSSGLKRSVILIAFDGEESGLIGSKRFVQDTVVPIESVKAMFSLDMVGMYDSFGGIELGGAELLKEIGSYLEQAQSAHPITIKKTDATVENRTDTAPFGNAGIPAIYVSTGISESPYHKPEDDAELLEYEGMVSIINFMSGLTMLLANEEEIPGAPVMEALKKNKGMKRLQVGVKYNSGNTYLNYPDAFYDSKDIYALGAGLFLELRINQMFTLQPEVLYETNGGLQDLGKLRAHSITTPLSLLITSPDPSNNGVRGYFQVGGYFTYSFGGKVGNSALDYNTIYNDQQYGLILGGGMEIMNFRVGYTSTHSFVDYLQTAGPDGNMRMKGSYFTMGWAF